MKERFEIEYVPPQVSKATLHLVTIGVSTYKNNLYNLKYATKDGEDLAKLFKNQRGIYQELIHYSLFDKDVTVTNITQIKKKLQKTNIDDAVIVFISGHGLLDSELDYYLATYDVNFTNPKENGLLYDDLENLLDGIPARKKILLIDACHSGELDKEDLEQLVKDNTQKVESAIVFKNVGNKELKTKTVGLQNSFELMRQTFSDLRKGTGTTVLSAAGGIEAALESNQWKNGAFTYCLLIGLSEQKADLNKDGEVMLLELQQYLFDEVPKITNGKQQPTSRIENLINDWRVW